jgi:hypothetical protein
MRTQAGNPHRGSRYCGELPLTDSLAVNEFVWECATPSARLAAGVGWVAGLGARLVQRHLHVKERKQGDRGEDSEEPARE